MVNKKIKVIAKIERDAMNYLFIKMLYGIKDSQYEPDTVYTIEDSRLLDNLIELSHRTFEKFDSIPKDFGFSKDFEMSIILYDINNKCCCTAAWLGRPYTIIVGTTSQNYFKKINYLIKMISEVIKEKNMGEFWVQYGDKLMTEEEFYEFQKSFSYIV